MMVMIYNDEARKARCMQDPACKTQHARPSMQVLRCVFTCCCSHMCMCLWLDIAKGKDNSKWIKARHGKE